MTTLPLSTKIAHCLRRIRRPIYATIAAILFVCALDGCATSPVDHVVQYQAAPTTRPDKVYVYPFDIAAATVQPDHGRLTSLTSTLRGQTEASRAATLAAQVQDALANELVRRLLALGLQPIRANTAPAPGEDVWLIKGRFETIDAGDRARRVVIGLGSGKSTLATSVEIWHQSADGTARLIETSTVAIDSGRMPGMAETLGVGAVAGHLVESAAVGGVLHTGAETTHTQPADDAKRMASAIAKRIGQIGTAQGWLTKH